MQRNGRHNTDAVRNGRRHRPAPQAQTHETLERLLELDRAHYAKRADAKGASNSYLAGESNRMNPTPVGVDPYGTDADYHYSTERNYFLMVERGRAAVRNHPLVEQGVNRLIANLRLTQIAIDPDTGDKAIDADLKARWKEWGDDKQACDWEQSRPFCELVAQSFFNEVVDGDILHIPLSTGQIQTWESHHIRSPFGHVATRQGQDGIVHGAQVVNGRTTGWHVTPFSVGFAQRVSRSMRTVFYPQFDAAGNQIAFYAGNCHRFQQRRGVSKLSPPRESMNGFDDLNYSHIKSALRRSLISYLMTSSNPVGPASLDGGSLPQAGDRYTDELGLGLESIVIEQAGEPAQVFKAPEGYTLEGWNANMPGSGFFEQSALLLTMLAVNLDLPLSMLLLDGSLVNFHGGRMTWDQTKLRLQEIQRHVIATRHAPTYAWKLRQWTTPGAPGFDAALAAAAGRSGVDLERVKFRPRGWPYVKPLEDAAAEDLAESRNLKSRRAILAERGDDIEEVDSEIIDDRARLVVSSLERAAEIAGKYPELDIDVGKLASELRYGSGNATGVQLTLAAGDGGAQPAPTQPQGPPQ